MFSKDIVIFFLVISLLAMGSPSLADGISQAGGDDVVITDIGGNMSYTDLVTTSGGVLFAAVGWVKYLSPIQSGVKVYRSTDGGTQWTLWGEITHLPGQTVSLTKMILAEGTSPRLYVLSSFSPTTGEDELMISIADPSAGSAVWTYRTIMDESGVVFRKGDICSDAASFPDYYLYVVGEGNDGNGHDIWFSRSVDNGLSWSAPYKIAELASGTANNYINPLVAYGFGGRVHVAWSYGDYCDGGTCHDNALRYRHALNDAGGGISDWQPIQFLTTTTNAEDNNPQAILASPSASNLFLLYNTSGFELDVKMWHSTDGGSTWPLIQSDFIDEADRDIRVRTAVFNSVGDKLWIAGRMDGDLGGCDTRAILLESSVADPLNFNDPVCLSSPSVEKQILSPSIVADPSSANGYAMAWSNSLYTCGDNVPWLVQFDATWRSDPGYPNLEPGFPVDIPFYPVSPPALVNLDTGPELEIVFSDGGGFVQVLDHTGAPFGSWPQYIIQPTEDAPVAVGDLNNSGEMTVVAGSGDGQVWAFDAQGNPMEGFPVDLGTSADTYVSIGPVAPPYPRSIVACSGNSVFVINRGGRIVGNTWTLRNTISHQAAIGDVTGDGLPEIIVAAQDDLVIIDPASQSPILEQDVTLYALSDAPVIADLEPDGLREILVSTVNGYLHCYHWDGSSPWSYITGDGDFLSGAAVGNVLGTSDFEIAVTSGNSMHLIKSDGTGHSAYPRTVLSGSDFFVGTPIIDGIHWSSPDIVSVAAQGSAWAFWNIGPVTDGWPKSTEEFNNPTPASSDVDNDGSNEVVVLTEKTLVMWDVNYPEEATANSRWPMDAHDPGRTGCLDCVEELVSDVDLTAGVTRVSFAPPNPNPATGPMTFSFALPSEAGVQLEVFDLRGMRVKMVKRVHMSRGTHTVKFDGRDNSGRNLASGLYYARLSVRGSGINKTLSRKFTILR